MFQKMLRLEKWYDAKSDFQHFLAINHIKLRSYNVNLLVEEPQVS